MLLNLILLCLPAGAVELQYFRCAKFLTGLDQHHLFPGKSRDVTEAALHKLERFRERVFDRRHQEPYHRAITASDRSSSRRQERVGWRIDSILRGESKESEPSEPGDNEITLTETYAFLTKGREAITHEIARRRAVGREAWNQKYQGTYIVQGVISFTQLGFGAATVLFAALPHWFPRLLAYANRHSLEAAARNLNHFHFGRAQENRLETELDRVTEGGWVYHSFDRRIRMGPMGLLRITGKPTEESLREFLFETTRPRTLQGVDRYLPMNIKIAYDPTNPPPVKDSGWLQVDELLTRDWETGEPMLVTVIRIQEKPPKFPAPATSPARTAGQGARQPVAVPVPMSLISD